MVRIGIMGTVIKHPNHGCTALLYSLLNVFELIENELEQDFCYVIFDWKYNSGALDVLAENTGVSRDKLSFIPYNILTDFVRNAYHFFDIVKMKKGIKSCDFIIDLTEGDSFSDIYGDFWFKGTTEVKSIIEEYGIPLILGPQTYGPFINENNKNFASLVIKKAYAVMTRDEASKNALKKLGIEAKLTSDMAFYLPFKEYELKNTDKIKVGFNASNLLYSDTEMKDRKFKISVEYEKYIDEIISYLLLSNKYEVYLISHVDEDYKVHKRLHERYPETNLVNIFNNPIEAKSCISQMDVFIGARMHGIIAALTTGVPGIATAYSNKFSGMFSAIGYDVVIDLCSLDTDKAIADTKKYIYDYMSLRDKLHMCENRLQTLKNDTKQVLYEIVSSIIESKNI